MFQNVGQVFKREDPRYYLNIRNLEHLYLTYAINSKFRIVLILICEGF